MKSQVTIGMGEAPVKGALLQLKEKEVLDDSSNATKGLNLPRVKLSNKNSLYPMFLNNPEDPASGANMDYSVDKLTLDRQHTGLMVYNLTIDPSNGFEPGIFMWNGKTWLSVTGSANPVSNQNSGFFYMPSFNLPINGMGIQRSFDLYAEYKKQFTASGNTHFISSNGTMQEIPNIFDRDKLDYVVTNYDDTLITILSISDKGIMEYIPLSSVIPDGTFINIVLVIKN
jgi:hypothetical protein